MRVALEPIAPRKRRLTVIVETPGGYIEEVERIVAVLRKLYRVVDFIVPSEAMSAGTVLVMSGDAIWMDYASVLGPIDPQVERPGTGQFVPALGYLEQYNRLIQKSRDGTLTTAELAYLIQRFDPAELYSYEQAKDLSIALLEEWLVKYKFRYWKRTETHRRKVTKEMKVARAKRIGEQLNQTDHWHSHSRGLSMTVLRGKLNLKIDDYGIHPTLGPAIRSYYALLRDYMARMGHDLVVHTNRTYHGH
jgi:predicted GIY-YIG superfamily endonuclease